LLFVAVVMYFLWLFFCGFCFTATFSGFVLYLCFSCYDWLHPSQSRISSFVGIAACHSTGRFAVSSGDYITVHTIDVCLIIMVMIITPIL
jgi:hypothetical protein